MATLGQIITAETRFQRPPKLSKSEQEAIIKAAVQKAREDACKIPQIIPTKFGMKVAARITKSHEITARRDGRPFLTKIEDISEMPEMRKKTCLSILSYTHEMKEVQERVSKFIERVNKFLESHKDLEYETITHAEPMADRSGKRLPQIFREDENGVLTLRIVNKKTHKIKEIGIDQNGRLISPKQASNKRIYRYFGLEEEIFLCAKILNDKNISNDDEFIDEFILVELEQLNQQYPIISAIDSKGVKYVSFGTSVRIDDAESIHVYRGAIQELQQKQK